MSLTCALALVSLQQPNLEAEFYGKFRDAVHSGVEQRILAQFATPNYAKDLLEMGARDMRNFKVHMIPAPAGRTRDGKFWAIVSTPQGIQGFHDMIFPVITTGSGLRLGKEIPEWEPDPFRIRHVDITAKLNPAESKIDVFSNVLLMGGSKGDVPVFRLGVQYALSAAKVDNQDAPVVNPDESTVFRPNGTQVVKVGGVVVVYAPKPPQLVGLNYSGKLTGATGDKIDDHVAYVTAWWVPNIGRSPFTTTTTVEGPADWTIVSEGEQMTPPPMADDSKTVVKYRCNVPITFPKIVGGRYRLAAEIKDGARSWKSYQLEPVDTARAQKDVALIQDGIKFYEANLGPFPFSSYSVFDGDSYYGIESYSYTLLRRDITTKFVQHELGHTYFGGLVSNPYTKDCWNESLTQYIDSIAHHDNVDKTLEGGLASVKFPAPLSQMSRPGMYGSATYYRGSYVLKMLDNEIGHEAVIAALKDIVASRRGLETTWPILRPYFEKAAGKDLKWFWDQWVTGANFSKLTVTDMHAVMVEGKPRAWVTVRQEGAAYNRMKFKLILRRAGQKFETVRSIEGNQTTFSVDPGFAPSEASIDVFGYTLATVGPDFKVAPR